ncbi:hypothetical protein ACFVDQ_37275 [Streptomyces sp. NPDC057684]|uniref:hypothetical protein n=1 Tax=Streptomyces sp. NPDC057684 TaxID=3346211 RepID=UPI00367AD582
MRTHHKTAVALAALLFAAAAPAAAQASPSTESGTAPSACRPANHTAKITEAPASAGHHHYRVTLRAPRGYDPCELVGSPHECGSPTTARRLGSPPAITVTSASR